MKVEPKYPVTKYGFEKPDFECAISAKVSNNYIGYTTIPSSTIVALSWDLNGIAYMGVTHTPQYNLIPIKKPWYKTCKFPCLVKVEDKKLIIMSAYQAFSRYGLGKILCSQESGCHYPVEKCKPATPEEALNLIIEEDK